MILVLGGAGAGFAGRVRFGADDRRHGVVSERNLHSRSRLGRGRGLDQVAGRGPDHRITAGQNVLKAAPPGHRSPVLPAHNPRARLTNAAGLDNLITGGMVNTISRSAGNLGKIIAVRQIFSRGLGAGRGMPAVREATHRDLRKRILIRTLTMIIRPSRLAFN